MGINSMSRQSRQSCIQPLPPPTHTQIDKFMLDSLLYCSPIIIFFVEQHHTGVDLSVSFWWMMAQSEYPGGIPGKLLLKFESD